MEKLIAWLDSERDYATGLALMHQFCKNRMLLQTLSRKDNPEKLLYEIRKMVPTYQAKQAHQAKKANKRRKVNEAKNQPLPGERLKIVRNDKTIKLEDLPVRLQKLYLSNIEMYKNMRALHERAKLPIDDATRAPITAKLVDLDGKVRANWATIDSWDGQPDVPGGAIDHRRINANRKFITDNRSRLDELDGKKRDVLKAKMQGRITELIAAGETFSKIKEDLIKQGFTL